MNNCSAPSAEYANRGLMPQIARLGVGVRLHVLPHPAQQDVGIPTFRLLVSELATGIADGEG